MQRPSILAISAGSSGEGNIGQQEYADQWLLNISFLLPIYSAAGGCGDSFVSPRSANQNLTLIVIFQIAEPEEVSQQERDLKKTRDYLVYFFGEAN